MRSWRWLRRSSRANREEKSPAKPPGFDSLADPEKKTYLQQVQANQDASAHNVAAMQTYYSQSKVNGSLPESFGSVLTPPNRRALRNVRFMPVLSRFS